MTIIEAINEADAMKRNGYNQSEKVRWLSRLEHQVHKEVFHTCEQPHEEDFSGYNDETSLDTVLAIPEPYSEAYVRYLEAQIDLCNGEMGKYNSSINAFNEVYAAFKRYHIRNHAQKKVCHKYF